MNLRSNKQINKKLITGGIAILLVVLIGLFMFFKQKSKLVTKKKYSPLTEQIASAIDSNEEPYQEIVQEIIYKGVDSALIPGYFFKEEVRNYVYTSFTDFYQNRNYHLAWNSIQGPLPQSDSLLAALQMAPNEGLFYNYHVKELLKQRQETFGQYTEAVEPDSTQLAHIANLDFKMTASYLTYASHLLSGKVDPNQFDATWIAHPRKRNLAPILEKAIQNNQIYTSLRNIMPNYRQYDALKEALLHYKTIAENGGWPIVPLAETLHPGERSDVISLLKRRLILTGDLEAVSAYSQASLFDEQLQDAVKRFQYRNGLKADGIVGKNTIAKMNVPADKRVEQIRINLERIRWLPDTLHERYVLVNIPEFRLRVLEKEKPVMEMKVIVGKEYRSTPIFRDTIQYIEFSPTWTVPLSIARKDILPAVRKDPGYLIRNNFKLYSSWQSDNSLLDPYEVDWESISPEDFNYRLVQQPGPGNSLGLIKFMFPNDLAIYLHDTPADHLFNRKKRAFSSGCVRVENPVDLALYLLQDLPEWDRQRVQDYMYLDKPETVFLPEPVPVQFIYQTAFVDEDGLTNFRIDIYGHDSAQIKAIQ